MAENKNIIAAFDEERAARLSGVSLPQLRYWYRSDFYVPAHVGEGRSAFSRIYSFKDIAALRVLHVLRNQFGVSLQHLRDVSDKLNELGADKWTGVKLYVVKRRVVWVDPESSKPQEITSGQYIVPVVLDEVLSDTAKDVSAISGRDTATVGKIKRSRYINHNAPVVAGTRVRVSSVKAFAEAGYSHQQIIEEFPDLTEADVQAALNFEDERAAA